MAEHWRATPPPCAVETLLSAGRPVAVTLVRCGKPVPSAAEAARSACYRSWPLGPPVVEHLRVARVERRTVPGGEAVTRILLPGAFPDDADALISAGPLAPLLLFEGALDLAPSADLAGRALWADLLRQAGDGRVVLVNLPDPWPEGVGR